MSDNEVKFWQDANFKKLQAKWAEKLKESGFKDIEQPIIREDGVPDSTLKNWSSSRHLQGEGLSPEYIADRTEYYRAAGQFLYDHKFSNHIEQAVWELHSGGISIRNIVKTLKKRRVKWVGDKTLNKRVVHETVQALAQKMRESRK